MNCCTLKLLPELPLPSAVSFSDLCYHEFQYLRFIVGILIFLGIRHAISFLLGKDKGQTSKLSCCYRDEDMDGEWEAPQIANPKCESAPGCGTWQRPMIDNPNYKGKWKPPMIDNVNYQVGFFIFVNFWPVQDFPSKNQNDLHLADVIKNKNTVMVFLCFKWTVSKCFV